MQDIIWTGALLMQDFFRGMVNLTCNILPWTGASFMQDFTMEWRFIYVRYYHGLDHLSC